MEGSSIAEQALHAGLRTGLVVCAIGSIVWAVGFSRATPVPDGGFGSSRDGSSAAGAQSEPEYELDFGGWELWHHEGLPEGEPEVPSGEGELGLQLVAVSRAPSGDYIGVLYVAEQGELRQVRAGETVAGFVVGTIESSGLSLHDGELTVKMALDAPGGGGP